jgi:hypothetical protein
MTEAITAPGSSDNEGRRRWRRPGATRADDGTSLAWRADELLHALGELVGRTVGDRFAEAPLFLPTESFAGEPFRPTLGWYKRVASRLMGHAGLGAYQLAIGLKADPKRPEANGPVAIPDPSGSHVLAWFAGLDRDAVPPVCHFGFDARQAAEPEVLVAALAHEVAHAFRAHHGLDPHLHGEVEDARARRLEEELTDITTHALGFGVLTTNASYRYRQGGGQIGLYSWVEWSHGRSGYLRHTDMSYLLAATLAYRARHRGENAARSAEARAVMAVLEVSQRDQVGRLLKDGIALDPLAHAIRDSARHLSPAPLSFGPASLAPHPVLGDDEDLVARLDQDDRRHHRERYRGRGVYVARVRVIAPFWPLTQHPWPRLGAFAVVLGAALGLSSWVPKYPFAFVILLIIATAPLVDLAVRRRLAVDLRRCAVRDCLTLLPEGAVACPGCGGRILGDIAIWRHRVHARESFARAFERRRAHRA